MIETITSFIYFIVVVSADTTPDEVRKTVERVTGGSVQSIAYANWANNQWLRLGRNVYTNPKSHLTRLDPALKKVRYCVVVANPNLLEPVDQQPEPKHHKTPGPKRSFANKPKKNAKRLK